MCLCFSVWSVFLAADIFFSLTAKKSKDDKPKKKHTESDHKLVSSNLPFEIVTHKNIYLYIHLKSQKYIALETLYVWFFAGLFSCLVMV